MPELTPPTSRLVSDLISLCRIRKIEWPGSRRARIAQLEAGFDDLGRCGEAKALGWTVIGLVHPEPKVVAAAASAAAGLLPLWPVERWPQLDFLLRQRWNDVSLWSVRFSDRREEDRLVDLLPKSGAHRAAGLILMACHSNGFVRQRAVETLSAEESPEAFAVLTLRLDDWVDVIRENALTAWRTHLTPDRLAAIVESLPLIERMLAHGRVDQQRASSTLAALLSTPAGHRELLSALESARVAVARSALTALRTLDAPPAGWIDLALGHADATIRFRAVLDLTSQDDDLSGRLDSLLQDPYTPIRRTALDVVERSHPEQLEARAREGLFDRASSIRGRCQDLLVMRFDVDPAGIYRAALGRDLSPRRRANALLGLAATGGSMDQGTFEAHTEAAVPRVRAAALLGLGWLTGNQEHERFLPALQDPSPRVVRAAEAILARAPTVGADRLFEVLNSTDSPLARSACVHLASQLAVWDRILLLLDALSDADPRVHQSAADALHKALFNPRGWAIGPPTPAQLDHIEGNLRFRPEALEDKLVEQLRFLVRVGSV